MSRKLISFDWAMKRLLRSKANFNVLEGFLSELLKDDITIEEVLESESNQETSMDKFNRVDLKVKNSAKEVIIIEIQYDSELDYFQRILYASSKAITEHMHKGKGYQNVIKVISINILYFNLGEGDDYIYRGTTRFQGLHEQDELRLTSGQKKLFSKIEPHDIFPEYYLIRVNKFNDIAKDTLDQWIYFFKNEEIKEGFNAKGLKQAKEALDVMKLSELERLAYEKYLDDKSYKASMYQSTYVTGHLKGKKEGREEGRHEEKIEMAILMKKEDESVKKIMKYTQLTREEIEGL
ncbi:MAG: Rpn family recombination-promoting nuclease/putative transposase [Cocleimonas sp.]|nr:Rpn family recombination-promoting nuclease/putative transposase [Cocleimonas sp.]